MFKSIVMINYNRPLSERLSSRKVVGPYTWQPAKAGTGRGFYQASNRLACDPRGSSFDLRLELANDHLKGKRLPSGYLADDFTNEDGYVPIIARLPHSRGFLAGFTLGEGMAAEIGATIYSDAEDAARAAHNEAERAAEKEREAEQEFLLQQEEDE